MQPGLNTESIPKDLEASSVVINGFGILPGFQAQSGLLANFSNTELCANWLTFLDANPVRKINSNAIDKVLDMEREYEYLEVSEELYHLLHEKAHSAGMSIDELILETFRNQTTTDEGEQAAQKKPTPSTKRRATKPKARSKRGFG